MVVSIIIIIIIPTIIITSNNSDSLTNSLQISDVNHHFCQRIWKIIKPQLNIHSRDNFSKQLLFYKINRECDSFIKTRMRQERIEHERHESQRQMVMKRY